MRWELDPDGDGIVSSRLSSADVAKGETALGHIHTVLDFCARQRLRPRWVTVSIRTTGDLDYEDRADIAFTRACIQDRSIKWAAWRDVDRLARQTLSSQQYYRLLENNRIDLYFVTHGGKINWADPSDRLLLTTLGAISEYERSAIKRRTHDAIRRRFHEEGRGHPNTQGVGFRRDAQKFVEVDPEQWPYIKRIHEDYLRLDPTGNAGVRPLAKHMADLGFPLGRQRLRDILRDEIYVTGEWSITTREGIVYPCRRIEIPDPIPRELFDRNQLVLDSNRSRSRVNPPGHYLLNTVPVYHEACRGKTLPNGKPVMLKARQGKYRHTGNVFEGCRGLTIDAAVLDRCVIEEMLRLVESPHLQVEYRKRAAPTAAQNVEQQLNHVVHRVRLLESQRAELKRRWLEDGLLSGDVDPRYLAEALGTLDQELASLTRRRKILESDRRGQPASGTDANLLAAAREVLTPTPPDDPDLRRRRLAFVQAAISEIVVRTHDDGTFDLEIVGALSPLGQMSPEADLLEAHRCELYGS
ncbi:MAG: recombinase family protein, partial [Pseudonocardiaceae bacterium]